MRSDIGPGKKSNQKNNFFQSDVFVCTFPGEIYFCIKKYIDSQTYHNNCQQRKDAKWQNMKCGQDIHAIGNEHDADYF